MTNDSSPAELVRVARASPVVAAEGANWLHVVLGEAAATTRDVYRLGDDIVIRLPLPQGGPRTCRWSSASQA
jgi:hypothetical protein